MSQEPSPPAGAVARVYEKRWWKWLLALTTLVLTADLQRRFSSAWNGWTLLESGAALAALVASCQGWRGKFVPGFLAIGAAVCIVKAGRAFLGQL
jgi:hypothetical protein